MYKEGKLPPQFAGDTSGWYLLIRMLKFPILMGKIFQPLFL